MKVLKWVYIGLFVVSTFLLAMFFISTSSELFRFSVDRDDWIDFAVFFSPMVSLFTLGAILYTLYENKRDEERRILYRKLEILFEKTNAFYDLAIEQVMLSAEGFLKWNKIELICFNGFDEDNNYKLLHPHELDNETQHKYLIANKEMEEIANKCNKIDNEISNIYKEINIYFNLYFHTSYGARVFSNIKFIKDELNTLNDVNPKKQAVFHKSILDIKSYCIESIIGFKLKYLYQKKLNIKDFNEQIERITKSDPIKKYRFMLNDTK